MLLRRTSIIAILILSVSSFCTFAQTYSLRGSIFSKDSGKPVDYATVVIENTGQWALADSKGLFEIKNLQPGTCVVSVSCLGFVTDTKEIIVSKDILNYKIYLKNDNLALQTSVVTAQENESSATTSRNIDKTALEHIQLMNVSDISGLLPGGATTNPSLLSSNTFNLRAGSSEAGNASFGTAVEVDGVRLSNNASFSNASSTQTNLMGASVNNIASSNVESVEVITGVPSVEYGDMTSGVVKINTKKGKTPYTATMSTSPKTKQFSLSKGFGLGETKKGVSNGILNVSAEYTQSISDQLSPYNSYDRKQLSLTYSNLFNRDILADLPLRMSLGFAGNLGGMNTKADPDALKNTWSIGRDNAVRANVSFDWLLNQPWITNLELNASLVYSDKTQKTNGSYSSAVSKVSLHSLDEGYFIAEPYKENSSNDAVLVPGGYWYNLMGVEDKPLTFKVSLKANWAKNLGSLKNKIKLGADWSGDGNFGVGQYTEDLATAESFREYDYSKVPFMNNIAAYFEDNLMVPVGKEGRINFIAGVRNDNTIINGSAYGTTSSLSPRFNVKYTVLQSKGRGTKTVRSLAFRASYGLAVKQPSFSVLYPQPSYRDINVFNSTTNSSNVYYMAYYSMPRTVEYNPSLKWQKSQQSEVGMEVDLGGNKISLAGFLTKTLDSYFISTDYESITYKYTNIASLESCTIPVDDRVFQIDGSTGVITVSDNKGNSQALAYNNKTELISRTKPTNLTNPITRYGLEWVVDFKKIAPINTTIRLDGNWYSYKTLSTDILASSPTSILGSDGTPYKYIGYYYGGSSSNNGRESQTIKTNLTVTTRIPKARVIISAKLETCLLKYDRSLSDRNDGSPRSYVLKDRNDLLGYTDESIYAGENYTVLFPDYYTSYNDPTPMNYLENLRNAKEMMAKLSGDKSSAEYVKYSNLYSDLVKLASTTSYRYVFKKDYITPYFSANFSVTKEIGDIASISFYANNFFNNLSLLKSTKTGAYVSSSGYIPSFYYGLTLRLKF